MMTCRVLSVFVSLLAAPLHAASVEEVLRLDVIAPFSVSKTSDLEFGLLTVAGAGRVDLDPRTNVRTTRGGVTAAGGTYGAATFRTRGNPGGRVRVSLTEKKIGLTRVGGTETLTLRRLRTDLRGPRQRLDDEGYLTFNVGGTLRIGKNASKGRYEGSFEVEVSYE